MECISIGITRIFAQFITSGVLMLKSITTKFAQIKTLPMNKAVCVDESPYEAPLNEFSNAISHIYMCVRVCTCFHANNPTFARAAQIDYESQANHTKCLTNGKCKSAASDNI